eukprot:7603831-Pyramimonas_sp.AAC.1
MEGEDTEQGGWSSDVLPRGRKGAMGVFAGRSDGACPRPPPLRFSSYQFFMSQPPTRLSLRLRVGS